MNVLVPDDALRLTVSSKVYPMLYALPACLQVRSRANCVGGCDLLVDKGEGERRGTGVFVREGFDQGNNRNIASLTRGCLFRNRVSC
jgi:hypothetical protein